MRCDALISKFSFSFSMAADTAAAMQGEYFKRSSTSGENNLIIYDIIISPTTQTHVSAL